MCNQNIVLPVDHVLSTRGTLMRRAGPGGSSRKNGNSEPEEPVDERLKNIDPKMVELITNEVGGWTMNYLTYSILQDVNKCFPTHRHSWFPELSSLWYYNETCSNQSLWNISPVLSPKFLCNILFDLTVGISIIRNNKNDNTDDGCLLWTNLWFNSLAPGDFNEIFISLIFKQILVINNWEPLWNCPQVIFNQPHWWSVNTGSGNGLVPSGNKPLPETRLTQI